MKRIIALAVVTVLFSCGENKEEKSKDKKEKKTEQKAEEVQKEEIQPEVKAEVNLENHQIANYIFLEGMLGSQLYPGDLVAKGQDILKGLCAEIEAKKPADLEALYALTDEATIKFNELAMKFDESGNEFETNAREITAADFEFIAKSYGFENADLEEMLREREW